MPHPEKEAFTVSGGSACECIVNRVGIRPGTVALLRKTMCCLHVMVKNTLKIYFFLNPLQLLFPLQLDKKDPGDFMVSEQMEVTRFMLRNKVHKK